MRKLTTEQREQFHEILEQLGQTLDISQTEYDAAVASYMAVGRHLSKEGSLLEDYQPEILPQGSFLLGTIIKPVNEADDLDIDLVCRLNGSKLNKTQQELKQLVGDQLKSHKTYEGLLETPDGRRCWTLRYRENAEDQGKRYHMDILPAATDEGYRTILERSFQNLQVEKADELAIRITDREKDDYEWERDQNNWLKSNPFGYALWFQTRAALANSRTLLLESSIQEVPQMQENKLPLQRIVQILKRHRDILFSAEEEKEDKPISIIITTLASRVYGGETNILEGLHNVVQSMRNAIEERYDAQEGRNIKWVANPVNDEENFADKWVEHPKREANFYSWLDQLAIDLGHTTDAIGMISIQESMIKPFGKDVVNKAFTSYGEKMLKAREANQLRMAASTATIGYQGRTPVRQHQNFGGDE
ncbi:MAG: nucleotidyltransferase [Bacteroidota bacterium]